jgi:hypothetical protein
MLLILSILHPNQHAAYYCRSCLLLINGSVAPHPHTILLVTCQLSALFLFSDDDDDDDDDVGGGGHLHSAKHEYPPPPQYS